MKTGSRCGLLGIFGLLAGCASQDETICDWRPMPDGEGGAAYGGEAALAVSVGDRKELLSTARSLAAEGRQEDALELLDEAIEVQGDCPELLGMRGTLLSRNGYRRAAEKDLTRATQLDPEEPEYWRALGRVRLELDLPASADHALRRCQVLTPECSETLVLLARAARECGRTERASTLYATAFEGSAPVTADMLVDGASLYASSEMRERYPKDVDRAHKWLARALSTDPRHPGAHFVRGVLLEADGKLDNAAACYRRAVEADPYCLGAFTNLALLEARRGNRDAARESAMKAIALEADPDRRRVLRGLFEDPTSEEAVDAVDALD